MNIHFDAITHNFVGDNNYTYKIFDVYGREITQDVIPQYSLALRFVIDEDELIKIIAQELQNIGVEGSLCQLCTRTGALAGCPKQKSSLYKPLTERETPIDGWEATPSDRMVRVQIGELIIPTLVKGWNVTKCPLFRIRLETQEVSEFIKIAQIMFLRYELDGSWHQINPKVISAKKETLESIWNKVYNLVPLYFERPEEDDE